MGKVAANECEWPKGERLKETKSFELFPPQLRLRSAALPHAVAPFWCCPNSNTKPAPKGEVAASVTSRRKGCNEASVVYVNPSVNPPCGVLPAPRPGSLLVRFTNSYIKPALKGEVAASATSRRRGCSEASVVYVNPSVNPPHGVLPAPRPGSLFDNNKKA